jgi:hypothetical protein
VLFLSNVVKAQGSMFSDGVNGQPETRKIGGTLAEQCSRASKASTDDQSIAAIPVIPSKLDGIARAVLSLRNQGFWRIFPNYKV